MIAGLFRDLSALLIAGRRTLVARDEVESLHDHAIAVREDFGDAALLAAEILPAGDDLDEIAYFKTLHQSTSLRFVIGDTAGANLRDTGACRSVSGQQHVEP